MLEPTRVQGTINEHRVLVYALSTCGWCRKTKALLTELGVTFDFVDVDLQGEEDRELAKQEVMRWNPVCSFPTIVVDDKDFFVGFQEDRIRGLATP